MLFRRCRAGLQVSKMLMSTTFCLSKMLMNQHFGKTVFGFTLRFTPLFQFLYLAFYRCFS